MYPDLPPIGPLHLHSYGLMLALSFWIGSGWLWREAARRGWDENRVATLSLVLLLVSVAGARLFFVFTHWADYARDPAGVLRLWEGGLTLYGGILAAIPAGILYCRHAKLPVWSVADAVAPALALGLALGRVGCFLNGCCFGKPCDLPWAVTFPPKSYAGLQYPGAHLHPAQLYFTAAELGLLAVLLGVRPRLRRPGQLWWLFLMLDSAVRFLVDMTRYYEPSAVLPGGLDVSQLVSLGLLAVGALGFAQASRTPAGEEAAQHAAD